MSVCLSVITFVATWLDFVTWGQVRVLLFTRTQTCNISQDDQKTDHNNYGSSGQNYILD